MTLAELLVAMAITTVLGSAIVLVMRPTETSVRVEQDAMDMEQRLRFAVDTLTRDLHAANDVVPRRLGLDHPDPSGTSFTDRATLVFIDPASGAASTRTYYLKPETRQLFVYDG